MKPLFLFSVDVEEFDVCPPGRPFRRTPLPGLLDVYLKWLEDRKATFFVVGEMARRFPDAIRALHDAGHEIACHTDSHRRLDEMSPGELRCDLERNREAILDAAPTAEITGFRAPVLSMIPSTAWAYEVIESLGFGYSSSVLAAKSPLYGWPGFGAAPRRFGRVLEMPITTGRFGPLVVPFAAGTYFRCLPAAWLLRRFRACAQQGDPVLGYFHPYDIDAAQERVMNRGVRGNPLLNALLYFNRRKTLERLNLTLQEGFCIVPYREYVRSVS
ncbi:MAG: polysaccharide deacetylase family protein [Verrucomicrobiae bacterium]